MTRGLAVDPGEKRLGLALSDETGAIAFPLRIFEHVSRMLDAALVLQIAGETGAEYIVIGQAIDSDGSLGSQARRAGKFAEAVKSLTNLPVILWDESGSTQAARAVRIEMKVSRRKRKGPIDDIAATIILQSYLDARVD